MNRPFACVWWCVVAGALLGVSAQQKAWPAQKSTDKCTPYNPAPYKTLDTVCALLDGLSTAQLDKLYLSAPLPSSNTGFPLRGCTYGCVPGNTLVGDFARMPQTNMGWSGKCFNFNINQTTGTPTGLLNAFAPMYDYAKGEQQQRVQGTLRGPATVYWQNWSYSDGKPVWTFNYTGATPLPDAVLEANVVVDSIRDEVRAISPGFMLGRMYIKTKDGQAASDATEMPLYFALFQACTADGKFATQPGDRALPALGGLQLPGGFVF